MPSSPHPNSAYTVGWISALPIEMAAAKGMLDEEHGDPQNSPQQADDNTYLLGCIGYHKVVVACLPKHEIGSSSAAAVAKDMLFTFPNIKIGLLVGIGGGIPDCDGGDDEPDIRLGDVVISSDKKNGGVVVYDFGKRLGDGSFEAIYALDRPPRPLRTALARLETEHETRENRISDYILRMLEKYPYMKKKGFTYPGQGSDMFFQVDYQHKGGKSCTMCDREKLIKREPENRPDTNPKIHYGTVATGSSVVKHAPTREEIRQQHKAICLEMEAAGLMNNFPCLVIRGISDYADSHKNDKWHMYAAATAAACAKELLEYVQPRDVDETRTVKEVLNQG
jgi:nucleoside phosphorylase